jgi:hypothetical protein
MPIRGLTAGARGNVGGFSHLCRGYEPVVQVPLRARPQHLPITRLVGRIDPASPISMDTPYLPPTGIF